MRSTSHRPVISLDGPVRQRSGCIYGIAHIARKRERERDIRLMADMDPILEIANFQMAENENRIRTYEERERERESPKERRWSISSRVAAVRATQLHLGGRDSHSLSLST